VATTVLIVDDHAVFRAQACRLVEAVGFEVVGEAADGVSAIEAARRLRPDLVLLDVQLPDIDGFAVADTLKGEGSDSTIVLISGRDAAAYRAKLAAHPGQFLPKHRLTRATLIAAAAQTG
jgi:DNA-binding NarL/FixJ family response regulator